MEHQRVQKLIAQAGICSRRKAEELIADGKVLVNGKKIKLGDQADPDKDKVTVDGQPINFEKKVYLVFYKPRGCLCTVTDPEGRKTIFDYIKMKERMYPVGRLDFDTEGLLLVTNDGEFANKMTHPSFEVKKMYRALLNKPLAKSDKEAMLKGVLIEGRTCSVHQVWDNGTDVKIQIHEGRKHIVKVLFLKLGYKVMRLTRTSVGNFTLKNLKPGEYYLLKEKELSGK